MVIKSPSFWLIPRILRDPSVCDFEKQRALITYNILYSGPIILVDSALINNIHLRDAILTKNPFIIELISQGYLGFAIREREGQLVPLGETAELVKKQNRHVSFIPAEKLKDSKEFDYIQNNSSILKYSLGDAEEYYQREICRIFNEKQFEQSELPHYIADAILSIILESIDRGFSIAWSFFALNSSNTIWKTISKRFPKQRIKNKYGKFVFNLARGPYVTFLPEMLKLNPIYSNEDRLGVDIWRGRYKLKEEEIARKTLTRSRISVSDFISGLAKLNFNSIINIIDSDEFEAYNLACNLFGSGKLSENDVFSAFSSYRRLIDSAIIESFKCSTIIKEDEEYRISRLVKAKNDITSTIKFSIKQVADHLLFGIPSLIEFIYGRIQIRRSQDEVSKARHAGIKRGRTTHENEELEKEKLIQEYLQSSPEFINGKIILDEKDVKDICTSIESA